MKNLSQREKWIAGFCLLACLIFAGQKLYVRLQGDEGSNAVGRELVLARNIAQAKAVVAQGEYYDRRLVALVKIFGQVSSDGAEMSRLTSTIDALARQARVRVVNVKPLSPRDEEFYRVYSVEVVLDGDWRALASLVHSAQAAENFFYVTRMELTKFSEEMKSLQARMVLTRVRVKSP